MKFTYHKYWDFFREEDIPRVEEIIDKYGNGCAVVKNKTCEIYIESEGKIDGRSLYRDLRLLKNYIGQERTSEKHRQDTIDEAKYVVAVFGCAPKEILNSYDSWQLKHSYRVLQRLEEGRKHLTDSDSENEKEEVKRQKEEEKTFEPRFQGTEEEYRAKLLEIINKRKR